MNFRPSATTIVPVLVISPSLESNADDLLIDLQTVLIRFGGDAAFAAECAELLEAELPAMLAAMRNGFQSRSAESVSRAAHTLKGAVSNFWEQGPAKTAARIDWLAREGQLDQARPLVDVLEHELAVLSTALRGLRTEAAS